jgi:hypothetical protein
MDCGYCTKRFANRTSLNTHQKTAKYCLEIQGVDSLSSSNYICVICDQGFSREDTCHKHMVRCGNSICGKAITKLRTDRDVMIEKLRIDNEKLHKDNYSQGCMIDRQEAKNISMEKSLIDIIEKLRTDNEKLRTDNEKLRTDDEKLRTDDEKLRTDNERLNKINYSQADTHIKYLQNKYMKKQPRESISDTNVIYIVTTDLLKTDRRYIMGKTKNLTKRMSTYNKSDEHEIVYYHSCSGEDTMGIAETLIFQKLDNYRERANRERFILPVDQDIKLFVDIVKQCVEFIE